MAQSALTVTQANPTPPTNLSFVGNTAPLDPAQAAVDDGIPMIVPNATNGTAANGASINEPAGQAYAAAGVITFAASTAAANTAQAPGAGISNTHEAKGTETSSTAASANPGVLGQVKMVGVGPANPAAGTLVVPNALHASTLSGTATPTLTGATGASNVSGVGTTVLTLTGTNFNRASEVYLNGVKQTVNYVSATSLTVTNALKRTTAGTLPVYVVSNGQQTAPVNWTLT